MRFLVLVLSLILSASADARLGETPIQFADRYGSPKDTAQDKAPAPMFALVEGAIHHTYEYQGWRIRAAFLRLDGPAVRMEFSKLWTGQKIQIEDYELQAIATANTPTGMSWKKVMYNNPDSKNGVLGKLGEAYFAGAIGEKMWQRTDGAILWLRSNLIVRLELPAVRDYEQQLKSAKEHKARTSVPTF